MSSEKREQFKEDMKYAITKDQTVEDAIGNGETYAQIIRKLVDEKDELKRQIYVRYKTSMTENLPSKESKIDGRSGAGNTFGTLFDGNEKKETNFKYELEHLGLAIQKFIPVGATVRLEIRKDGVFVIGRCGSSEVRIKYDTKTTLSDCLEVIASGFRVASAYSNVKVTNE